MDEREMLHKILELTEDTNRMTRKLYHAQIWRNIWSFIYWLIIVGLAIGAFYFIQPYIQLANDTIAAFRGTSGTSTININLESLKGLVK